MMVRLHYFSDVCHQVLDLYSPSNQPQADSGESPPPPPPGQPNSASRTPNSQSSDRKRSLQVRGFSAIYKGHFLSS